ncbi:TIGR02270 family protein [Variovorax paradoxus]|uniref:TIGR02270 family protein n=1 Tax=Variovorax paradoxus TaxID=34073 RepID=UPI003ECE2E3F
MDRADPDPVNTAHPMFAAARPPIPFVVQQHLDNASVLRSTRAVLVRAPHVQLHRLSRLDERLAASLDGLAIAGDFARGLCMAALETPGRGAMFANAIGAIDTRDPALLERLLSLAEAVPEARVGLVSAFGWVPAPELRGITRALLDSPHAFRRDIGLAACAMHHADPQTVLETAMADEEHSAQAIVVAGKLGRIDLLPGCLGGLMHEDAGRRFESARAALLLGDRQAALRMLVAFTGEGGPCQAAAAMLALKVLPAEQAHALLQSIARKEDSVRILIRGIGAAGDPHYVPWLIAQMGDLKLARLAGESFSTITGLDLAAEDLELKPPENPVAGPNDNPDDEDVAMDEDEGLPWPDAEKIDAWWQVNGHRFPHGIRCFVGEPVTQGHCLAVLKTGFQRQRIAAAEHLSLMAPGRPLFNAAAPAWRQQWLLSQMEA